MRKKEEREGEAGGYGSKEREKRTICCKETVCNDTAFDMNVIIVIYL